MTVEFNKITGDEVELFSIYPELFNNFWSNNDLVMEYDISEVPEQFVNHLRGTWIKRGDING